MCGCSVNLSGRGASASRSSELPIQNTPEDVISFVVDNNPSAVRENMKADGIATTGLTDADIKRWLTNSYNLGYEVAPYVVVPYVNDAPNYTGGLIDKYPEMLQEGVATRTNVWTDYVLPFVFGGLGALGGTAVLNQTGLNTPPPPPPSPSIPIWVWVLGGFLLVIIIVVLLKR